MISERGREKKVALSNNNISGGDNKDKSEIISNLRFGIDNTDQQNSK